MSEARRGIPPEQEISSGAGRDDEKTDIEIVEAIQLETECFERLVELNADSVHVNFGEPLPLEHPLTVFVNELAKRLPKKAGRQISVQILPGLPGFNALALPDGQVGVSLGLLQKVKTQEALLGVLAHEWVHVYRQHVEKMQKKRKKFSAADESRSARGVVTEILEGLSQSRGAEYEADLRGAIFDLGMNGINPEGYFELLTDLSADKEGKPEKTDLPHGSMSDRRLNVASLLKVVDFSGMEQPVRALPTTIVTEIETAVQQKMTTAKRYIDSALRKHFVADTLKKEDIEHFFQTVPARLLQLLIRDFPKIEWAETDDGKKVLRSILVILENRFFQHVKQKSDHLSAASQDTPDAVVEKQFLLEIFCRHSDEFKASLEQCPANDFQTIKNKLNALLKYVLKNDVAHYAFSIKEVYGDVVRWVIANQPEPLLDLKRDLEGLSDLFEKFVKKYVLEETTTINLERVAIDACPKELAEQLFPEAVARRRQEQEKTERKYGKNLLSSELQEQISTQASEIFRQLAKDYYKSNIVSVHPMIGDITKRVTDFLTEHHVNVFLADIGQTITAIKDIFNEQADIAFAKIEDFHRLDVEDEYTDGLGSDTSEKGGLFQHYSEIVVKFLLFRLTKALLEKHPAVLSLSPVRQNILRLSTIKNGNFDYRFDIRLVIESYGYLKYDGDPKADLLNKKDRKYLDEENNVWRHMLDEYNATVEQWTIDTNTSKPGSDDVIFAFQFLVEQKSKPEFLHIGDGQYCKKKISSDVVNSLNRRTELFLPWAVFYLDTLKLTDIVKQLAKWKETKIETVLEKRSDFCAPLVRKIIQAIEDDTFFDLPFLDSLRLIRFVYDPLLRQDLQRQIFAKKGSSIDFTTGLDLFFPHATDDPLLVESSLARRNFLENDVVFVDQYRLVCERLSTMIDRLVSSGDEKGGAAVLLDQINLKHRDVVGFLAALMYVPYSPLQNRPAVGIRGSDAILKKFLYISLELQSSNLEDKREKLSVTEKEIEEKRILAKLYAVEEIVQSILFLDDAGKHVLLRKLLTSSGGALRDKDKREQLFSFIFDVWVERSSQDKDVLAVLDKIKDELVHVKNEDILFFALQNVFSERIGGVPNERLPYKELYEAREDLEDSDFSVAEIKAFFQKHFSEKTRGKIDWSDLRAYLPWTNRLLAKALTANGKKTVSVDSSKMEPFDFVRSVASKSGALGVRFLQLLPQFVTLTEEQFEKLSGVYDRVFGQEKLAAFALLEREWPELWEHIHGIGRRVGGGSIVSVFELDMKDGSKKIAKVRNPNIRFNLKEAYEFAKTIARGLGKKYGGGYAVAERVLDDIREWITSDIDFTGFLDKDKKFKDRYDGFASGNSSYPIQIPTSYAPENPYFSLEEFIPGTNLTQWKELAAAGHDMKQIMSVLVKFFFKQVADGQVLSDVHPGNCAVTPDRKLAIYDRNFYLELSEDDKQFVSTILIPGGTLESKILLCEQYFPPPNDKPLTKKQIGDGWQNFFTGLKDQNWNAMQKGLVDVRTAGVKIPLKISLLFKNLQQLNHLSMQAGFTSLLEAFAH